MAGSGLLDPRAVWRIVGRFPDGAELADALDEIAASRTGGRDLPELD